MIAGPVGASTIAQNSSWTITRPGSTETLRVVAYGDSIYAGYISIFSVAKRAAPHVSGEYGAALWGQNVQVVRRCQSGAVASGVYSRINSATDRAFIQTANTRAVAFEMCGNDYLQARSSFKSQTGTCNYAGMTTAGNNCANFTALAMQSINANAHANVKLKIVSNLYYPGWNADNVLSGCNDPVTGQKINFRAKFFPLLAESNWTTCKLAEQYGFECADAFAEYMAGDYDSNDDGLIDSEAIRFRSDESKEDYIQRVTVDLLSTIRDSNFKMVNATTSFDYLLSDDTHPTNTGGTGSSGTTAVQFPTAGPYPDGKNPAWNQNGHDRLGWNLSGYHSLTVDAGPDATILECESFESAGSFDDNVFTGPWTVDISYGDGGQTSESVTDMTFDLSNQYTAPGAYDVDVVVEGSYGVTGTDSAAVTVLSATAGDQNLKD
jgi:lysophospholipase L1-like esterase